MKQPHTNIMVLVLSYTAILVAAIIASTVSAQPLSPTAVSTISTITSVANVANSLLNGGTSTPSASALSTLLPSATSISAPVLPGGGSVSPSVQWVNTPPFCSQYTSCPSSTPYEISRSKCTGTQTGNKCCLSGNHTYIHNSHHHIIISFLFIGHITDVNDNRLSNIM
jgi:hypothetical protein